MSARIIRQVGNDTFEWECSKCHLHLISHWPDGKHEKCECGESMIYDDNCEFLSPLPA